MDWLSHISQINWLAVLLAFVASMAIGFVWYMPAVLGKRWMAAIGKTEEDLKNTERRRRNLGAHDGGCGADRRPAGCADQQAGTGQLPWRAACFALVLALVFRAGGHVIHNGFAGRPRPSR